MRVLLNFSCIDWHDHSWAPSTYYGGDRVGYEGQSVFDNGRIQFVNSVFNSGRSSRRGVLGGGCRDSRGRGIQTGLPYAGHSIDSTPPHCIPSAGLPYTGYLNRNLNSCVGRVRENQRDRGDRGNHGEISDRCVDRENRMFFNRRGSYGSNRCDLFQ